MITITDSTAAETLRPPLDGPAAGRRRRGIWIAVILAIGVAAVAIVAGQGTIEETKPPTYGEYDIAVRSAIGALRASDGVQGTQLGYVGERLAGAVWFDSRSSGDRVVVQRQDRSVQGWPADPSAAADPDVVTRIWVQVGGVMYGTTTSLDLPQGSWTMLAPGGGETRPLGLSLLDRSPTLPPTDRGVVSFDPLEGGGGVWTLRATFSDGDQITRCQIGPDGVLVSLSFELVGVSPQNLEYPGETSGQIVYTPLVDPDPIVLPDLSQPPDLAELGLPADFPL